MKIKISIKGRLIEFGELTSALLIEYCEQNVIPINEGYINIDILDAIKKRKLLEKILDLEANFIIIMSDQLDEERKLDSVDCKTFFGDYRNRLNIISYLEKTGKITAEKIAENLSGLLIDTEDFIENLKVANNTLE